MKKCPKCGYPNPDQADRCGNCDTDLPAPAPRGDLVMPAALAPAPPPPAPAAASSRPPIEVGPRTLRPTPRPQPQATAGLIEDDLREIEESGLFTIGVIGFATSGKTFFINRLKKYFRQEGGYDPKPAPPDDEQVVEGTTQIEAHRFYVLETDAEREGRRSARRFRRDREPFYMIDLPGEQFRKAVEADLAGELADTLLKVLRLSHALIIVLPADDLLAPWLENHERLELRRIQSEVAAIKALGDSASVEERRKLASLDKKAIRLDLRVEKEKQLERLLDNIALISAIASELLDSNGEKITLERYRGMSEAERAAAYTGKLRGPAPFTYVALAKADRLISPQQLRRVRKAFPHIAEPDLIDIDPGNVVRLHRPKIHQRVTQSFAWHKFDFVTCFEDQPADEKRIHYWLPHHGVEAVVEWIHWARIYSRKSGRRDPVSPRRFERFRAWWDRTEGGLARRLAEWHESGSRADPAGLGLDPGYYRRGRGRWLDGARAWISGAIARLMDPAGHGARLILLGAGALVASLSVLWLLGAFESREQRGYSFAMQPVYSAEIEQMERSAPVFGTGMVDSRLRKWTAIPSDGGWFSFAEGGAARGPLRQALQTISDDPEAGTLDRGTADRAISSLQASAGADRRQVRAANSYHEALLRYLTGDAGTAAATFAIARDELERARADVTSGARYEATSSRMAAVRASIRHGLGTAELVRENGDVAAALGALREAREIARDPSSGVRDATALSRFWFPLTTRDRVPMIQMETAGIWTNLLAALIRSHRIALAEGDRERAESLRRELYDLVTRAADHAEEAAERPRLAANLMIASARSGGTNSIASFFVNGQPPEDAKAAIDLAQIIARPNSASGPEARYWATTQRWRALLSPGGQPRAAAREIAKEMERNRPDAEVLRLWLADVMETEYERSSGAGRRELTLNYGQYYDGPQWLRYANAYAPFGFVIGAILSFLIIAAFLAIWIACRRVRPIYVKLHVPQHKIERLASAEAP